MFRRFGEDERWFLATLLTQIHCKLKTSVWSETGHQHAYVCNSRPAGDVDENRTVLLIGEFGNADDDPPVKVLIVDDLFSDATDSPQVNFRGTQVSAIPLDAGPEIILAAAVPKEIWSPSGRGTSCPNATKQVVRVT